MYHSNNSGAQFMFATLLIVVVLALTLGLLISNSEWLQPTIAEATAKGMNNDSELAYKRGLIDLEKYANDVAAIKTRTQLALESQTVAEQQFATFRAGFYNTLNFGLMALLIAVSVSICTWVISKGVISYKLATASIQTELHIHRTPSPIAQQARQLEKQYRQEQQNRLEEQKCQEPQLTTNHIEYLYTRPCKPTLTNPANSNPNKK